ncbi:MAG TPA: trypsin-like peptidase domain-containing protein [Candidatus Polarisedimenticolaceae bacterium]|nr:trypsin-like peptidase domain-containing protein [Candidatus Polarisedimenticolaceae bacterium]
MIRRLPALALAALAAAGACRGAAPPATDTRSSTLASEAPDAPLPEGLTAEERRDIGVFRKASASVVFITNFARQVDLFSFDAVDAPQGTGSGFVWDKDGHIVTNYHVIEDGTKFSVALGDDEYDATVVGAAADKDLAVLKIEAPAAKLTPLTRGRSADLIVGQRVLAVGNPFGFDHTLTTGVVSGLGRELRSPSGRRIRDVIQTDAAINPGNSGGPLLDSSGRLIGINSAIFSPSGASAGIGFAVPVDTVSRLVPQLIRYHRIQQPGIVGATFLPDYYAKRSDIDGVVIREVEDGSSADQAGLSGLTMTRSRRIRLGDVIVGVEGKQVHSQEDLYDAFETAGLGATVKLSVVTGRGTDQRVVRVKLGDLK